MSDTPTDPVPERTRIEPVARRRMDALPVLYLAGFLILAGALAYLWRHPAVPPQVRQQTMDVETIRQQLDGLRGVNAALTARIASLEGKTGPDLSALTTRLDALEKRPAADTAPLIARLDALDKRPAFDPAPLVARLDALEKRPAFDPAPLQAQVAALQARPPVNLAPLETRIAALEAKPPVDFRPLQTRLDQVEAQDKQLAAGLSAITERAARIARMQGAAASLAAGQPLGAIPGATPALSRFASAPPPTEAGLRLGFDQAAAAAQAASEAATTGDQPLLDRMWTRAQQSLTVRKGDHVIVGDPIAGVLQQARQQLDAGDLSGAVVTLGQLAGPPRAAMADWLGQAQALLDARAAIAGLANG